MSNLTPFWRFLESRVTRTAVMVQWRLAAGAAFDVVRPLLVPTGHKATAYPDAKGWLRVVYHHDGSIVGVDDHDWEHRRVLTHDQVVLYRADAAKLRKAVSDSLSSLEISRTPIDPTGTKVHIANWEPKKAAAFPVHLLLCRQRSDLQREVMRAAAGGNHSGAILLTPTRAHWDDQVIAEARGHKLLLAPLCEIVEADGGIMRQTPAWEEFLQSFCQMVRLTLPGNYRNKKSAPMRGTRAANIEKLQIELERHLIAARDHAQSRVDRGLDPELLPRPTQTELARQVGLTSTDVSRCLSDKRATLLKILWDSGDSLEAVMRFKRRS